MKIITISLPMTATLLMLVLCMMSAFDDGSSSTGFFFVAAQANATNASTTYLATTTTTTVVPSSTVAASSTLLSSSSSSLPVGTSSSTIVATSTSLPLSSVVTTTVTAAVTTTSSNSNNNNNDTTANDTTTTTLLPASSTLLPSSTVAAPTTTTERVTFLPPNVTDFIQTTQAIPGLLPEYPSSGFQIVFRPSISGGPNATANQDAMMRLLRKLADSPVLFAEAFRADLSRRLNIPMADLAVDAAERSIGYANIAAGGGGSALLVHFRVSRVHAALARQQLEEHDISTVAVQNWTTALNQAFQDALPANSSFVVDGIFAIYAAPDTTSTTFTAGIVEVKSAACFVGGDCPGTWMVVASIVFTLVSCGLSVRQYWIVKKNTEREEKVQKDFEKMVEERNQVRTKLASSGVLNQQQQQQEVAAPTAPIPIPAPAAVASPVAVTPAVPIASPAVVAADYEMQAVKFRASPRTPPPEATLAPPAAQNPAPVGGMFDDDFL